MKPGHNTSPLKPEDVRLILRIYWTDKYAREAYGFKRSTPGIRNRLAKQFGVSYEVIKKIVAMKSNEHRQVRRRRRFKTIDVWMSRRAAKANLKRIGVVQ